jgi:uncharacterized OB-fold protein
MGFVTEGTCRECGKPTFAADQICAKCKAQRDDEPQVQNEKTLFDLKILDCD